LTVYSPSPQPRDLPSSPPRRSSDLSPPGLRARSHVQPCAIDVSGAPDRAQARQRLRVAPEQRLVVIASRLVKSKRVETALAAARSEEHTSELQSRENLVGRLLLEKK